MAENDGLFGMGGMGVLIILFFLMSGGFGGFGGWGANGQVATSNEVQRGFDNQNSMANQREILGATNQVYHDLVSYVGDKYAELDRDVLSISGMIQQSIANENQCCCNTLRAIDSVKYDNLQNTNKILEAMNVDKDIELDNEGKPVENLENASKIVRHIDDTIKEQINYIFNYDVSDVVFGNQSPMANIKGIIIKAYFSRKSIKLGKNIFNNPLPQIEAK